MHKVADFYKAHKVDILIGGAVVLTAVAVAARIGNRESIAESVETIVDSIED